MCLFGFGCFPGGLFKAKEQRTEAEIVAEGGETVVEHPIDHLEAEVVEEEVVLDGEQPGKGNHEAAGHEQVNKVT